MTSRRRLLEYYTSSTGTVLYIPVLVVILAEKQIHVIKTSGTTTVLLNKVPVIISYKLMVYVSAFKRHNNYALELNRPRESVICKLFETLYMKTKQNNLKADKIPL